MRTLAAAELSLRFGGTRALRELSLELDEGTVLGVVGPNGAGKSTLVNVLSGHLRPNRGSVELRIADGSSTELTGMPPTFHWRQGVARSFQGMRLYSRLTVFENIVSGALGSLPSDLPEIRDRAADLLCRFELQSVSNGFPGELSVGQNKLVGVARALVSTPHFILLDEPLAGLDQREIAEFLPVIRETASTLEAGILLIDHDLEAVSKVCDRILVMSDGTALAEGGPDVFQLDSVQSAYMGTQSAASFQKHWEEAVEIKNPRSD